jgi:hypothetical protein
MAAIAFAIAGAAGPARGQSIPFADTEDATLSEIDVKDGGRDWHPVVTLDIRNGDYARGALDDDDAALDRVPVHMAFGGALVLRRSGDGNGDLFVIGQSSNGFHAPRSDERAKPRAWYESNNLLGLAWLPAKGLTTAATYTLKTSPNGVASTTHEASVSILYTADRGLGRLKPRVAITRRTQGEGGFYTIAGINPSFKLLNRENGPSLGVPVMVGVGWNGFYAEGSGTRLYGSGGLTLSQPINFGGSAATLQADIVALVRDDRLRRLDMPGGTTAAVVPHATISLTMAW